MSGESYASLFSGCGGVDVGLSAAGHRCALLCESDPHASAVLRARLPGVPLLPDVRDLATLAPAVRGTSMVAAGFPCTDLSAAGRKAGIDGERSSLVRSVLALLAEARVPRVLIENVPNWRLLARGRAMHEVVSALERLGYRWAYRTLDPRGVGMPQRRMRIFLLACLDEDPVPLLLTRGAAFAEPRADLAEVAHGFYWTEGTRGLGWTADAVPTLKAGSGRGGPTPPAVVLPGGGVLRIGIGDGEAIQGFERGWTAPAGLAVPAYRRWMMVGNAVAPAVARWIGDRLASGGSDDGHPRRPCIDGEWPEACSGGPGAGRLAHASSPWPASPPRLGIEAYLEDAVPLPPRAAAGFLSRLGGGGRPVPAGLAEACAVRAAS